MPVAIDITLRSMDKSNENLLRKAKYCDIFIAATNFSKRVAIVFGLPHLVTKE